MSMTESEAIKVLEKPSKHIRMVHKTKNEMEFYTYSADLVEAFEKAISALEEVQQYRAIGTVEDFKYLKQSEHGYDNCHNITCRTKCEKDGYAKGIDACIETCVKTNCQNCIHLDGLACKLKGDCDDSGVFEDIMRALRQLKGA